MNDKNREIYWAGAVCSWAVWFYPIVQHVDQWENADATKALGFFVISLLTGSSSWLGVGLAISVILVNVVG